MTEQNNFNKASCEQQVRNWVSQVVVGLNLCPFAKHEVDRERVRYRVLDDDDTEQALQVILDECAVLDGDSNIETSLLIYPHSFKSFEEYLDFHALAEDLLEAEGYEGVYQLATFHPDYCFADSKFDDPANYTNRAPYPMLHLIREESLAKVLANHPDPDSIPGRNIELCRDKGLAAMKALLESCLKTE